jgi:hypothetical protein
MRSARYGRPLWRNQIALWLRSWFEASRVRDFRAQIGQKLRRERDSRYLLNGVPRFRPLTGRNTIDVVTFHHGGSRHRQ